MEYSRRGVMPAELIEIEAARRLVLERARPLPAEEMSLDAALGRVLAADATSAEPVPRFDNSAMDGFAVRSADTARAADGAPVRLAVAGESRAGRPAPRALEVGEAISISTGAMVPDGADAVVRVEDTRASDGAVEVSVAARQGENIRRAGEDVRAGQTVIARGTEIGPAELGVLASLGLARVKCARRPRVSVLTTGDELHEPGEELPAGGIRNTNAYSVPALAARAGAELAGVETAADEPAATREAVKSALDVDVAVICGGVSVGEHDHVRPALAEVGAEQLFWGVALKPGKPTWFGVRGGTLIFGLPGNPVSAMVTFLLFVRPALRAMLGAAPEATRLTAVLDSAIEKRRDRAQAVRCSLEARPDGWHARPTGDQGSHVLTSMLGADALAILPTDKGSVRAGERVTLELLP
jgi:molybdopterin molybdotransferase